MDVLRRAYSDDISDDDGDDTNNRAELYRNHCTSTAPTKRLRSDGPSTWADESYPLMYPPVGNNPSLCVRPPEVESYPPVAGRYVSKRDRARLAAAASSQMDPSPPPPPPPAAANMSPVVGSISDSGLPYDLLKSIRHDIAVRPGELRRCSGRVSVMLERNGKAVNSIQWSPNHAHLLASAGMNQSVHVWNVWNRERKLARAFRYHNAAIKDVKWSPKGLSLLSCGYDCSSRLVDVEKGVETQKFSEDQVVETIRFHPTNPDIFLSCGSEGSLKLWDVRLGKVVKEYLRNLGRVLDVEFSPDGRRFISSSDITRSNASENAIIVWDVERQIPLSNQVYTEAYTCPCIRYHPQDASFIAQSNGNYVAIFSARPPFKLDRYKRYEKHTVLGYPIKCNFSLDGDEIATGSADGYMYFYSYRTSELLRKIKASEEACVDVAFHPKLSNVVASCGWNGDISVFE